MWAHLHKIETYNRNIVLYNNLKNINTHTKAEDNLQFYWQWFNKAKSANLLKCENKIKHDYCHTI